MSWRKRALTERQVLCAIAVRYVNGETEVTDAIAVLCGSPLYYTT